MPWLYRQSQTAIMLWIKRWLPAVVEVEVLAARRCWVQMPERAVVAEPVAVVDGLELKLTVVVAAAAVGDLHWHRHTRSNLRRKTYTYNIIRLVAIRTIIQFSLCLILHQGNDISPPYFLFLLVLYGWLDYGRHPYVPPFQVVDIGGERLLEAGERNFCRFFAGWNPRCLDRKIRTEVVRPKTNEPCKIKIKKKDIGKKKNSYCKVLYHV